MTPGETTEAVRRESLQGFKEVGRRLSNWGRWGDTDELGTLNFVTAERRVAAARLVVTGKIFDLGMSLDADGPQRGGARFNPIHRMTSLPGEDVRPGGMMVADDMIIMPLQCSTQWDALAHVGYDGLLYNGAPASTVTARAGATRNSIDRVVDRLVGRGVLLDIATLKGAECMAGGEEITPDDLNAAEKRQGVEVGSGDILLIRTGWHGKLRSGDTVAYMGREAPGIGLACCEWLYDREVAAVAADTRAVEVSPSSDPPATHPVHMVLLRDLGMTLGEMFDLEELARDCEADGVWQFLFSGAPLKVTGGVGSPLTPLAIK